MRLLSNLTSRPPIVVRYLPSGRFFMRFVPLVPDLPPLEQAALALEGLAPFPQAQLYWGCWIAPDRASALVYAAHRRRFTAEETAGWEQAELAVPDLLPLLGPAPAKPALWIRADGEQLAGVAWDGGPGARPAAVLARTYGTAPTEAERHEFVAVLTARAGLAAAAVTFLDGRPDARREGEKLIFELTGATGDVHGATVVAARDQDLLDARDRAFIGRRRRERRQGELIWKVLRTGLYAALAAGLFEAGALGFRLLDRVQQSRVTAQAAVITKLETAHGLASRVDELTHRRLRFFEMLAAINESRPRSVQFMRTGTSGRNGLEIEAQTSSADDVGAYEAALRNLPILEKVEVRDLRARDGVTTFGLTLAFKAEANPGQGGAP